MSQKKDFVSTIFFLAHALWVLSPESCAQWPDLSPQTLINCLFLPFLLSPFSHCLVLVPLTRLSGQSIYYYTKSPFYESTKNMKYKNVKQRFHTSALCLAPSANCTTLGTYDRSMCTPLVLLTLRRFPPVWHGRGRGMTQHTASYADPNSLSLSHFLLVALFVFACLPSDKQSLRSQQPPPSVPPVCKLQTPGSSPDGPIESS